MITEIGITAGDIILEVGGKQITADTQLGDLLRGYNPGDQVTLKLYHDGKEKTVSVTLGEAQ